MRDLSHLPPQNIGDFSRYARKPTSAAAQVAIIPFLWVFTSMFGAIATCCLKETHGEIFTTPFQIVQLWQGSHSGRFFAFVCSAAWVLGYIGLNSKVIKLTEMRGC
mgnify:FL=1